MIPQGIDRLSLPSRIGLPQSIDTCPGSIYHSDGEDAREKLGNLEEGAVEAHAAGPESRVAGSLLRDMAQLLQCRKAKGAVPNRASEIVCVAH